MAKVKMKYDYEQDVYIVKSKSLIDALGRATLIVTALGEDRVDDFLVFPPHEDSNKFWVYIYPQKSKR